MAAGTLVSRVLGVAKATLVVYAIGVTSSSANAFAVGNKLPNMLFALIGGGVLQAVLVPQVVRAYKRPGGDGDDYVNRLLTLGTVLLAGMTVVLTIGAPVLVALTNRNEHLTGLTVLFAYWCLPQVLFYGLYTLIGQVLNARGSYGPLMWAPVINNVVAIAGLGVYLALFGNGAQNTEALEDPGTWTGGQIALLAGTATLGVVAQALVLIVPLYRSGFRYQFRWGFRGVGLGQAGRVASWTFAGLGVGMTAMFVVTNIASAAGKSGDDVVVAGNAVYDNAFLIFMLPHSLVTLSLLTALFTGLSAKAAVGDVPAVRADLSFGLRSIGLFTVIAGTVLIVLALPLVHVVLPSASAQAASAMAPVIAVMMLGLPAFGAWSMAQRVFYAYANAKAMFPIQVTMAVIVMAGALATQALAKPRYWVAGASLAMTVSYGVGAVVALWMLRRKIGRFGARRVLWMYIRVGLAAAVAGGAGWAGVHHTGGLASAGWGHSIVVCVGAGLLMSAVYVGFLKLMRVDELDDLLRPLLRRVRRSA